MARQAFFSNIINRNINNTLCALFTTVEKLTFLPTHLAPDFQSLNKCNEFASFFSEKIRSIRVAINTSTSDKRTRPLLQPHRNNLDRLSTYNAINTKTLEDIVKDLNSSTCCLDTLPTSFFKNVFSCLEMDENCQWLTGIFPKSLKSCCQLLSPF